MCFRIAQLKRTFCLFELFFFLPGITVFLIVCSLDTPAPSSVTYFTPLLPPSVFQYCPWFDRSVLTPSLVWCGADDVKSLFCHMYEECVSSVFLNSKPHFFYTQILRNKIASQAASVLDSHHVFYLQDFIRWYIQQSNSGSHISLGRPKGP